MNKKKKYKMLIITFLVLFVFLFIFFFPYLIFAAHHMFVNGDELYTYIDNNSLVKGEPINIIIQNISLSAVVSSMKANGWREVPTFSLINKSTWEFSVADGITPVSPRYFSGKIQRVSLEGGNSTIRRRHHARFWELNNTLYGTISYDFDVVIVLRGLIPTPTHTISQDIDKERNLAGKVIGRQLGLATFYKDNTFPWLYRSNNAGSWYYTDGEAIVLTNNREDINFRGGMLYLRRVYFRILGFILNLF